MVGEECREELPGAGAKFPSPMIDATCLLQLAKVGKDL